MIVKLLTEHHLKFLSLRGNCRATSESTLVKMEITCHGSIIQPEHNRVFKQFTSKPNEKLLNFYKKSLNGY